MITDLTQEEARKLLSEQKTARLGCVLGNDKPYVVPINYLFKDDCIYFHSMFGLKIVALRANPKTCLQVDKITNFFSWQSVVAFGEFEEVTDEQEQEQIFQELFTLFHKLTPVEAIKRGPEKSGEAIVFRIRLRHITGRAES